MYKGAADAGRLASFCERLCAAKVKKRARTREAATQANTFCMRQ